MILSRSLTTAHEHNTEQTGPMRQNGRIKRNDLGGVIFYSLPPHPPLFLYGNSNRDHQLTTISTCNATTNIKLFYFTTATTVFVTVSLIVTKFETNYVFLGKAAELVIS